MATNRSGHRPAGGLHSRNVRHSSAPKQEPRAYARNPGAVGQYGSAQGDHATALGGQKTPYRGEPDTMRRGYQNPVGPTSMALSGPGSGRKIHSSGSQGQQGSVNPGDPRPVPSGHIIDSFGPTYKGSR